MPTPENSPARSVLASSKYLAVAVVLLGAGLLFGYLMSRPNAGKGNLKMKIGSASVEMNVENDLKSLNSFLDKVFKDDSSKQEMAALLSLHKYYSINDSKLIEEIAKLTPDHSTSKGLRNLSERQLGPFKNQLVEIRLSFPSNPQFRDDEAVVCSGSDLFRRQIVLYDMQEKNNVTLMANRTRPCPSAPADGSQEKESVQITKTAAKKLFGEEQLNTLNMFERAYVGPAAN